MSEIILKDIPGYEGLYQVDNYGVIYYFDKRRSFERKILKTQTNNSGYTLCHLHKNKKREAKTVHRIVANIFIPNPENKPQVNHKNGIKIDNRVENLEWVTRSENQQHARGTLGVRTVFEKCNPFKGKPNLHTSKPIYQIDSNGNILGEYSSAFYASKIFGINHSMISRTCLGKQKATHGLYFRFKYENR